ncbi:MAG TPA: nodulation protein NfeD [Candidatus Limnocylindria bacterium]|nr:nodulation protein NfeD [Candidatus Limnocylindria bacterium]
MNERDQDTLGVALARAIDTQRVRETPFASSRLASRLAPATRRGFTFQLALAVALITLGAAGALLGQTDLTEVSSVAGMVPGLGPVTRAAPGAPVVVGHIEDAINPITARYVERVIADAQAAGAPAVVFVINTPGGLIDSTYRITTTFLNAPLPVVTYVAPSGARAASAGTFITMAGAIAAMAPATNIGAAHPVDSSGGDIQGDLRLKAENDAAAQITKIAKARGRNEQWAEDAVRKSVSVRDDEAVQLKVVDLIARDLPDLLAQIDGRIVQVNGQAVQLATKNAAIDDDGMNPFETMLHFVVDPQIALLLFTIGTYGLIFELSNPGLIFPGIIGVIAIVIALFSFGTLDANAAGIALMIFSLVLFIAEVKVVSHGLLLAGGIVSLLLGAIIVFPPGRPTFPGLRYTADPVTLLLVVGTAALFFAVVVRMAVGFQRLPVASGAALLVGSLGVAKTELAPTGIVRAGGDEWSAVSEGGAIPQGAAVRVRRIDGLRLIVGPEASSSGRREN